MHLLRFQLRIAPQNPKTPKPHDLKIRYLRELC